ncbi:hypothetical protein RA26_00910 [Leisingera sp. ANG-M7]|nr:hypothetical protein RA26_00910 [Leisingera sp. ANG-M7]
MARITDAHAGVMLACSYAVQRRCGKGEQAMTMRMMRTVAICAVLSTLLGCSGPGMYPFSGQAASPDDPVQRLNLGGEIR